ncbi:SDR family NAD(P)-dependent oxidoreductase [Microbispora bryophytorum]|uniref:SDR family NAD(P)-dependent oxidoreductase n=1 Tax=Microbispora bryophytorum TaxID=1460882 RepID=UPI00372108EC
MPSPAVTLPGACGAPGLLALVTGASAGDVRLGGLTFRRPFSRPHEPHGPQRPRQPRESPGAYGAAEPAERTDNSDRLLDRYVLSFAPAVAERVRDDVAALPPGVVLVTGTDPGRLTLPHDAITVNPDDDLPALPEDDGPRHIRVLVDLSDPALTAPGWSPQAERLLRLHERMFLVVRHYAARCESLLVTLVGGITDTGVALPFTGLFTGFVKSLALELPAVPIVATLHTESDAASALDAGAAELANRRLLPVVAHVGGRRLTLRALAEPARPTEPPVARESLVVAAGGARGIGAALLTALAERYGPRIVVLGSTRLDVYDPELLDIDPDQAAATRPAYIKGLITGPGRIGVAEANAAFDRLQEARTVRRTLRELERHCGAGRVAYLHCDLRDREAVGRATDAIAAEHGRIDLLVNVAGTNRASAVGTKSRTDFLAVRDLKLRTYLNLKSALAGAPPRRWCNFGSFVGFTGQHGETDYGSANDFLNSSSAWAAARGETEFTIGWTLWRDIGLGATPIMKAFLAKAGQFTATPTEEGVAHFLAELGHPAPPAMTVLFGEKERAAITAAVPEYLDWCAHPPQFLDKVVRGPGELTASRTFDLDRDGYLRMHVVNGYPTLPGTFVPELAAEAAKALVPHRLPVVFEDVRLESFLRVYRNGRPQTKKIHAQLVSENAEESVVQVRILGDVHGPGGRILAKDRLHFSATVRMRDGYRTAPSWQAWDDTGATPVADPYHAPASAALLTEVFVSTDGTRLHPRGRRARLALDAEGVRRWFPDLLVPSVLLDGLARVAVLDLVDGRWTPVAIPRSIRRIEVFGPDNDAVLLGRRVELYSVPEHLDLEDAAADNLCVAVAANGDVLLEIEGTTGQVLGYVDQETGAFLCRDEFARRQR